MRVFKQMPETFRRYDEDDDNNAYFFFHFFILFFFCKELTTLWYRTVAHFYNAHEHNYRNSYEKKKINQKKATFNFNDGFFVCDIYYVTNT